MRVPRSSIEKSGVPRLLTQESGCLSGRRLSYRLLMLTSLLHRTCVDLLGSEQIPRGLRRKHPDGPRKALAVLFLCRPPLTHGNDNADSQR